MYQRLVEYPLKQYPLLKVMVGVVNPYLLPAADRSVNESGYWESDRKVGRNEKYSGTSKTNTN